MIARKAVYSMRRLTLAEAIRHMPFEVLIPARGPWPDAEADRLEIRAFTPLAAGRNLWLAMSYLRRDGELMAVHQSDTSPTVDPGYAKTFAGCDRVEWGGREMLIAHAPGGASSLSFAQEGTHVTISGRSSDRHHLLNFALSFSKAEGEKLPPKPADDS